MSSESSASPPPAGTPAAKLPGKGPAVRSGPLSEVAAGLAPGRVSGAAAVDHDEQAGLVLGVIVPCRDEATVIARKLRNLAASRWPFSPRPHQIVVVDDGSRDDTFELATRLCAELFAKPGGTTRMSVPAITHTTPAAARVIRNTERPGKAGALRAAIVELGSTVDLLVSTDADVILRPTSLLMLEPEFRSRPDLGMACGRQELVRDLLDDGSCRGADGREPTLVTEPYDLWSERLRAWESRRGRLFSVHGQLLAWRERLGLCPSAGAAADDVDLMFQVRAKGLRIELLTGATFLEVKPPPGPARDAWRQRRAQAWLAALRDRRTPPGAPAFDRWQLAAYRRAHVVASPAVHLLVTLLLLVGCAALGALTWGAPAFSLPGALAGFGVGALLLALLAASPLGRGARAAVSQWPVLRAARAAGAPADRWETRRG
ncbi:MAG TPA: glycosyltransferase family 2 protein [Planctomycetota bacterium]|nr:glycosyltransferase family 2 protein [Planctomycetota bacterium]